MSRFFQVAKYAWKQSEELASQTGKSRLWLFYDMLNCYKKYLMWTNQYIKEQFWSKSNQERERIGADYFEKGKVRDAWQKDFRENRKFLIKYTNIKYEKASLREKRNKAYTERYKAGKNFFVEYDVNISRQHYLDGKITIGDNVLLAKHVFIDYSGELILHDGVAIANGVIIETHTHHLERGRGGGAIQSRLEIGDGVKILSRSYIADTCHSIGRYARIGAGTYVRNNIPPYAIVMGNPAKIIGFLYSPEEMEEFEKENYPESERTPVDKYSQWYEKYFRSRSKEIKSFIKL